MCIDAANTDILHAYIQENVIHVHTYACTHTHTHKHTGMHAHTPLMRMEISLSLSCHPRLYPCHQLSQKSKKFEVLSFIPSRCWTVPGSQAIKHKVTPQHHFSPSVLLFRTLHHYFPSLPSIRFKFSSLNLRLQITTSNVVFSSEYMTHKHIVCSSTEGEHSLRSI